MSWILAWGSASAAVEGEDRRPEQPGGGDLHRAGVVGVASFGKLAAPDLAWLRRRILETAHEPAVEADLDRLRLLDQQCQPERAARTAVREEGCLCVRIHVTIDLRAAQPGRDPQ